MANEAEETPRLQLRRFPLPDDSIDLLRAGPDQLSSFGLAPLPDEGSEPEAFRFAQRMLSGKPLVLDPSTRNEPRFRHNLLALDGAGGRGNRTTGTDLGGSGRTGTSKNWSGTMVVANDCERLNAVWASWVVPKLEAPAGADALAPPPGGMFQCSVWVGLDGHRLHSRSLPQIGTTHILEPDCGGWRPSVEAWVQWWVRDAEDNKPDIIENVPLEVGDEVMCRLTVASPTEVQLAMAIKNEKTGKNILVPIVPMAGDPLSPVEGSAAEWVVERPTEVGSGRLYELPDYGQVVFTDCGATMRRTLDAAGETPRSLDGARLIRMYKEVPDPHRVALISVPNSPVGMTSEVAYREAR